MRVAVVDIGMGNVGSVANMVRKVGGQADLVERPADLAGAERVILPGVGAFDEAMARLHDRGFVTVLDEVVASDRVPVLGICLGMQLLADSSEEGVRPGLGWIPGTVERIPADGPAGPVKVPHMGWSRVVARQAHPLVADLAPDARFYFVHSYAYRPASDADTLLLARYGGRPVVAGVARGHVMGVQFHPEKSHRHGMALVRSFLALGARP
ncbi:MAG: imidazole glycerol phosphate synthase subunit HisH [Acidimicrobiales bacterium]|nr:imidazole glycerol phosphate synthase subunit HisH [Acidimicrobiales bacterium]